MSPREVIAMALSNRATCHEDDWDWFDMADAVIDALEGMEVTGRMASEVWEHTDGTATDLWRAMIGAMKEE